MSIRSYVVVKKRDVLEGELEMVVPASMAVKAELPRTAGVKRWRRRFNCGVATIVEGTGRARPPLQSRIMSMLR